MAKTVTRGIELPLIIMWVVVSTGCGIAFMLVRNVINKRISKADKAAYQFVRNQIYIYVASDLCMVV
jgi:hypothetical protein